MLFYNNLDQIVFNRNQLVACDELIIISGYVGPKPIHQLKSLPIKATVIYGMYGSEGIRKSLHQSLLNEQKCLDNVSIMYSTLPIHAKCYMWNLKGNIQSALIGSANFSTNGLTTPYKEILADATVDTFSPLKDYMSKILDYSIPCTEAIYKNNKKKEKGLDTTLKFFDKDVCSAPLYLIKDGVRYLPMNSGLNWGMSKLNGSHVNISDAYISISAEMAEFYPNLFPQKREAPLDQEKVYRKDHKHNDNIEIIWDDGTVMTGLLEGSRKRKVNGNQVLFPKQISTSPSKAELGKYIRKRLGIPIGVPITYEDLVNYGRDTIDISLQGEGVYYFDFSNN